MAENQNIHWTDDEELLSKFVLHQLPLSKESELSSHLDSCEKCHTVVLNETRIAAGAKLAGRTAMKERLRQSVSGRERHVAASTMRRPAAYHIPWTRIASVAAVAVVVIVVGVYNHWFSTSDWEKSATREQLAQETVPPPSAPAGEGNREPSLGAQEANEPARTTNARENDRVNELGKKRDQSSRASGSAGIRDERYPTVTANESTGNEAAGPAKVEESRTVADETYLADQAITSRAQAFWVEGHVFPTSSESRDALMTPPSGRVSDAMRKEAEARKDLQQQPKTEIDAIGSVVSLRQKPSSSLPASLQHARGSRAVIQTLIENNPDSIQMTLYLDAPVSDAELRAADIRLVSRDSLILNLSSRSIGLRLPPPLQGQVNTKARQVK